MNKDIRELVAIGASAAVNCHPCMQLHLAECDRLGIDRDLVRKAMHIGLEVSAGAAAKTRGKIEDMIGQTVSATGEAGGCGCG